MTRISCLVDTSIVVHVNQGHHDLALALDQMDVFVSVITVIELYSWPGDDPKRRQWVDLFLSKCTIVELTYSVQQKAIEIRKAYRLRLADAIIAASAIDHDLIFLSTDKDFKKCGPELKLTFYKP